MGKPDDRYPIRPNWTGGHTPEAACPHQPDLFGGSVSRRRFLRATLAAMSGSLLAACTLTVPELPEPTPTVAPASVTGEVTLGLILSLTGRYSREGALMLAGYQTWQRAVEEAGGIKLGDGRRALRIELQDDASEPLNAGRHAERLAGQGGIGLLLGPFSSGITTAVAMVTSRLGAVLVAPDASAAALYRRALSGLFSILPTDDHLLHGLADLAASVQPRAQPVGIIIADEPTNAAAADGFRERAAALGLQPVRLELTALGSADITPPLERLAADSPRFVILATEAGQTRRYAPSLREYLPNTAMRALIPLPGPVDLAGRRARLYDGVLTVENWSDVIKANGPVLGSASEFAQRFVRQHGYAPDVRSAAAAAAGLALQLGIEQAASADPVAVQAALSSLDVTTFWGPLAWDLAGRNRLAVPPVLQQQGDQLVAIYPQQLAGGQLRYPLAGWPRD